MKECRTLRCQQKRGNRTERLGLKVVFARREKSAESYIIKRLIRESAACGELHL